MRETNEFLKQSEAMVQAAQRKAGINSMKVQQTVSSYLQTARDNQLNYNELLQVLSGTKEAVLQSLNKVPISVLPDITSAAATACTYKIGDTDGNVKVYF